MNPGTLGNITETLSKLVKGFLPLDVSRTPAEALETFLLGLVVFLVTLGMLLIVIDRGKKGQSLTMETEKEFDETL